MLIVSKDREVVFNFDSISHICVDNNKILCVRENDSENFFILGEYETTERAKEILKNFIDFYSRKDFSADYATPIILAREKSAYYMPEY